MKIKTVKKCRKAQGSCNRCHGTIEKGEKYYYWKFRQGGITRNCQRCGYPRASQLTRGKLADVYAAREDLEDLSGDCTAEDAIAALQDAGERVRAVAEEYQESYDNMEQAFPNGCPTMEDIQEKQEACEQWADALGEAASELEDYDPEDEDADRPWSKIEEALSACEL